LHGPVPLEKALDYAGQVADGLEAAHKQGIIHRDLKPANVKVTPQGRVKILDFGLARAVWGSAEDEDLSRERVIKDRDTLSGHILGTPGYMSPEQTRGEHVDQRTDIWAFGCLFLELLTGKRTFHGKSQQDTLAAVLDREPDWQQLPAATPPKIRELLHLCLQKEPKRRLADITTARLTIEAARRGQDRWRAAAIAVAALAVIAVISALWLRGSTHPADRSQWVQLTRFPD